MADNAAQQKEVESTAEEVDKSKSEEAVVAVEDESNDRSENGEPENGDSNDKAANGKEAEEKNGAEEETDKVCSIKRKSTGGGDAVDGTPAEGATPEKKAKLDEAAEAESNNGEAEVAA